MITLCERHNICRGHPMWDICDELCFKSKSMYNYANWFMRQEFINTSTIIKINDLDKKIQHDRPYKELGSQLSQRVLYQLDKNWKSFLVAIKDYYKHPNKYLGEPKIPKYLKKNGRNVVQLKNIQFKIIDGYIRFSLKSLKPYNNLFKTKVKGKPLQIRIVPKGNSYVLELVYESSAYECSNVSQNIASIDLGLNNFATVTNNIGVKPFIINGRGIKSYNQYWNKQTSKYCEIARLKNNKNTTNRIQKLNNRRYWKMNYYTHCASKHILDWCIMYNIDTLVIGRNKEWKQNCKMHKITKQNFLYIPYYSFIEKLEYKCKKYGINFIETDESYTSGTSFLDNELPIKENYDKKRRIKRGLFRSNNGTLINSDINGSLQIMKKVFPNSFDDGIVGLDLVPYVINLH